MGRKLNAIVSDFQNVLNGDPWYGKPVYLILEEVDEKVACQKISANKHACIELLYHLISWSGFTLASLQKDDKAAAVYESLNFRKIDIAIHHWKKGVAEFKAINKTIIQMLKKMDDAILEQIVPNRKYDYCYLLNGLIQHHIYHIGQIAFICK